MSPDPHRTCVGCRERDGKRQLVRYVAGAGSVVRDERQRATGRGAYVHAGGECLDRAVQSRGLARALRVPPAVAAVLRHEHGKQQAGMSM